MRLSIEAAVDALASSEWTIVKRKQAEFLLPNPLVSRYPKIPIDYVKFLALVVECVNKDANAWFLCVDDFDGASNSAFAWNEFEIMGREAFADDRDMLRAINHFWNTHLPILTSVKSGYSYLAINVSDENFGKIVYGREPEFEETQVVSPGFQELLVTIANSPDIFNSIL